jgi:YidC/Oxa1 family membrane protein insertase
LTDRRNLILTVVLSLLVLFGWTWMSDRYFPQPKRAAPTATITGRNTPNAPPSATPSDTAPVAAGSVPAGAAPTGTRDRVAVLSETPRVNIATPLLAGSVNLRGARIDDLVMTTQRETIAKDSPPVRLFTPSGTDGAYFAQFGWTGPGAPPTDALWTASGTRLTPALPLTLRWTSAAGAVFEIVLAVDDGYLFTATQRVSNPGATPLSVRPWGLVSRTGEGTEKDAQNLHVGPLGVLDGQLHEASYAKLRDDGAQSYQTTGGWLGQTDKYWLAALIPDQSARIAARYAAASGDRYQTDYLSAPVTVAPGTSVVTTAHLFAGAKEVRLLDRYKASLNIPLFDRAISWGWFWFIAEPIFHILDFLFRLTGNFGVAIIGLTIVVKTIMFPVAAKQYSSMAKMRVIQPQMKALQDKYKGDKPRQQTETMALYKKEKVNPVAGCLPVFLQIPIFYALYKTLLVSTEMRHQPFVLWIHDLAAPDPLTPVNLFGLLPFTPPHVIALGVLSIVLGVTMYFQQKLTPTPAVDPVQKQMMAFMPWVFMFIMASFAAGLQLYWITNNLLSIAQQWVMLRRHPMPATPAPVT